MDFDKLILNTIEIEGLLRVLRDREDPDALALLKDHVTTLSEALASASSDTNVTDDTDLNTPAGPFETTKTIDRVETDDTIGQIETDDSTDNTDQINYIDPVDSGDQPDQADQPDQPDQVDSRDQVDEIDLVDLGDQVDQNSTFDDEAACAIALPSDHDEPATINDLARLRKTPDLAKAFSINDKFRYIREVFSGDSKLFDNAIGNISSLESLDLAYDYLFNELQLDPENESVGEFLTVVANHYNTRQ